MQRRGRILGALLFLITIISTSLYSFSKVEENQTLFTITRNIDDDILYYVLNVKDGVLNKDEPIRYFWQSANSANETKELNYIQKKFVYGLNYTEKNDEYLKFNLHAYKQDLFLKKSSLGKYFVLTRFDGDFVIVNRIFIQIDKLGSLTKLPQIPYVEVYWYSPKDKSSGVTRVDVNKK